MNRRGQGSLEYLLLIGGGVLVAVVIISVIISIPSTVGTGNEYGVASAQCLAHIQSTCGGKATVNGKDYYCVWNDPGKKCLAQQQSCPINLNPASVIVNSETTQVTLTACNTGVGDSPIANFSCGDGAASSTLSKTGEAANCKTFEGTCGTYSQTGTFPAGQGLAAPLDICVPANITVTSGDSAVCGNDTCEAPTEGCDDGAKVNGDGCDSSCAVETGWNCGLCSDGHSTCTPICGDEIKVDGEQCDDGGTTGGDGCSATCATETGWECFGEPSDCYYDISACGFSNWVAGRHYTLQNNLSTAVGTCLSMAFPVNNVLLDCRNTYTITASTGVAANTASGFTVKNCRINATTEGIRIGGLAGTATVQGNTISITGTTGTRWGIRLLTTSLNPINTNHTVESNTITFTKQTTTNRAIYIHPNARNNIIKDNHATCSGGNGGDYSIEVASGGAQNPASGNNYCPTGTCSGPTPVCNIANCTHSC